MAATRRRLLANLVGLTAVACSNLIMGGPAVGGGTAPVPQADPSEVLLGVGLTILSQLIGEFFGPTCYTDTAQLMIARWHGPT